MNELILELFQAVSDKPELDEAGRQRVFILNAGEICSK